MNALAIAFLIAFGLHVMAVFQIDRNTLFIALSAAFAWIVGGSLSVLVLAS